MTNNNIAIEIIEQEIIRTKESFEFWAEESNGHQNNLATTSGNVINGGKEILCR